MKAESFFGIEVREAVMIVMSERGYVNGGLDAWEMGRLEEDDMVLGFYFNRFSMFHCSYC